MTNREAAIEWFSMLKKKFVKTEYEGYLDLAISALEKQEVDKCCETCKHKHLDVDASPCCDCIRAKDHYIPYTGGKKHDPQRIDE